MTSFWIALALGALLLAMLAGGFLALAMGRLSLDLGWGRSLHELGPLAARIEAPRELVYEVLSAPYLGRASNPSIDVLARSDTLVVAAHLTKVHFYEARTVEIVDLEAPARMGFRHLNGPVPHAVEEFVLDANGEVTELRYGGELGIDFFALGRLAGRRWVVPQWNRAVAEHLEEVTERAEERARHHRERRSAQR